MSSRYAILMIEPFLSLLQGLRSASQRLAPTLVWSAVWLAGSCRSWRDAGAKQLIDNLGEIPGPGCGYRQSSSGARGAAKGQRHASMRLTLAGVSVGMCGGEGEDVGRARMDYRPRAFDVGCVRSGFFVERSNRVDDGRALDALDAGAGVKERVWLRRVARV